MTPSEKLSSIFTPEEFENEIIMSMAAMSGMAMDNSDTPDADEIEYVIYDSKHEYTITINRKPL